MLLLILEKLLFQIESQKFLICTELFLLLQTTEDTKKELRSKTYEETLNCFNGHTTIFSQMTEKSKLSKYLAKTGTSSGTKADPKEGISKPFLNRRIVCFCVRYTYDSCICVSKLVT